MVPNMQNRGSLEPVPSSEPRNRFQELVLPSLTAGNHNLRAVRHRAAILLRMEDWEKLWPILSDMSDCAALIAAVFAADTLVFHAIPRFLDLLEYNPLRLVNLPR